MSAQPVDVLAVLDHHAAGMRNASKTKVGIKLSPQGCANLSDELSEARAAVAGLIEADKEYDSAEEAWGRRNSIENGRRLDYAIARRRAALARVQGGAA